MGTTQINVLVNDEAQKKQALRSIKNRMKDRERGEEEEVEFVEEGVEKGEREVRSEEKEEEGDEGAWMKEVQEWVKFSFVAHDDIWMRDFGPIFVTDEAGFDFGVIGDLIFLFFFLFFLFCSSFFFVLCSLLFLSSLSPLFSLPTTENLVFFNSNGQNGVILSTQKQQKTIMQLFQLWFVS